MKIALLRKAESPGLAERLITIPRYMEYTDRGYRSNHAATSRYPEEPLILEIAILPPIRVIDQYRALM